MNKLIVDLDNGVWLEPAGYGFSTQYYDSKVRCTIGKFNACVENKDKVNPYALIDEIIGQEKVREIISINDGRNLLMDEVEFNKGLQFFEPLKEGADHEKAVRLLLEELAKHPDKVEIRGTYVRDSSRVYS